MPDQQTSPDEPDHADDQWSGPVAHLPPVPPWTRADGVRRFSGISYALVSGYRPLQLDLWVPQSHAAAAGGVGARRRLAVR